MTTRHLVDPEILPMLDMFPGLNLTTESLPQMRTFLNEMNAQILAEVPEFPNIAVSEQHIPGPKGAPDVRVLVYLPKNVSSPMPALLWIHGGGYVIGNADQADPQIKMIVSTSFRVFCSLPSLKTRFPLPRTIGKIMSRYSSMRSSCVSV